MSIRKKITIPAILMTVVSIAAVLITVIVVFSNFVDNSVFTEVDTYAAVLESKLEDLKRDSKLAALAVAGDMEIRSALASGNHEALIARMQQLESSTGIEFAVITDATGTVVARSNAPGSYGDNIADQHSVDAALQGTSRTYIEESATVKLSVHSGHPVYGEDGNMIGTVSTGYRLDTDSFVDGLSDLTECEVSVFFGDTRIATTVTVDSGERAVGLVADREISQQVLGGEKFSGAIEVVGNKMYAVYLPIDSGDGEVVGMLFAGRYTNTKAHAISGFVLRALLVSAILLAIGIPCMILIGRRVTRPIAVMVDAAKRLARGDVEVTVVVDTNDEMKELEEAFISMIRHRRTQAEVFTRIADGDLSGSIAVRSEKDVVGKALNAMLVKNNEVFQQINDSAHQVKHAAQRVADGSQQLSASNVQQASAVEQLSITVADIAQNTRRNARRSEQATSLAIDIRGRAQKGKQQMDRMMDAVRDINEASASIEGVMKAIDDLAFQTNILALNAAVEAARAGQHGKGFAVVADEVRNLAVKSAEAAKNSSDMVQNTKDKAVLGSKIATETAESLNQIVEGINQSAALVEEISEFTGRQAEAIEQITESTQHFTDSVQFTSTLSEETSSASQELFTQAALMREMVRPFHLRDNKTSKSAADSSQDNDQAQGGLPTRDQGMLLYGLADSSG